jgi:ribonuclease HII
LVAAATIYSFDEHWVHEPTPHKIVDSKLLNIKQRLDAELWLKNQKSFDYHVQEISVERIDEINIYWARMEALSLCVLALIQKLNLISNECHLLVCVDGPVVPPELLKHENLNQRIFARSKGDLYCFPVAAASILAKNYRDRYMAEMAKVYPQYAWEKNVGYPTPQHKKGIKQHGITSLHRRSFTLF